MLRRTWIGYVIAAVVAVAAVWFYVENRRLEREVARLRAAPPATTVAANDPWASGSTSSTPERAVPPARVGLGRGPAGNEIDGVDAPVLPEDEKESRMERRQRRQDEMAAFLGRRPGESEDDYKARILPLLEMGLAQPRADVADMRAEAEKAAGVTEEQHAKLDAAFDGVYEELVSYTDGAIADGQLSPYERNVAGMLDYAGGLGGILSNAQQKIGGILTPAQIQTMSSSGFEWAEYLGLSAPWEQLHPPPPPAPGGGS
jgi:hypothetical protein